MCLYTVHHLFSQLVCISLSEVSLRRLSNTEPRLVEYCLIEIHIPSSHVLSQVLIPKYIAAIYSLVASVRSIYMHYTHGQLMGFFFSFFTKVLCLTLPRYSEEIGSDLCTSL